MLFCNIILLWTTAKLYRMHNFHCCLSQLTTPVQIFQINLLEEIPPPIFVGSPACAGNHYVIAESVRMVCNVQSAIVDLTE